MIGLLILGIFLILYGLFCLVVGLFKAPGAVWNMKKIEGFRKVLGDVGTQVFLAIWGAAALAGGIVLCIFNWPK